MYVYIYIRVRVYIHPTVVPVRSHVREMDGVRGGGVCIRVCVGGCACARARVCGCARIEYEESQPMHTVELVALK